ncbi:MAG: nuclease, partial [Actinomyces succiniciruminis]|nr:nuclease [Actinomyces succiniciruminis]
GGQYHIKNSLTGGKADQVVIYGKPTDTVLVGDWNGNGKDTLAVRRGGTYYIKNSLSGGAADFVQAYGRVNDKAIVGDWNGDGKDTLGVVR